MQKMIKTISGIVTLLILGAFPITSFAASAPTITTLSAGTPTATTVTVTGYFNANGATTSTWIMFGTSASSLTQSVNPVNRGTGSGTFTHTLSGLTPNTTYYFKAVGSNFYGGTVSPVVLSFTTAVAQNPTLTLTTLSSSGVTTSAATLTGNYNATLIGPTVWFKYGTSSSNLNQMTNPQSFAVGSNNFTANVSGLQANTTYYYQAVGTQAGRSIVANASVNYFTTAAAPVASMTVITLSQSNVTQNSATLTAHIAMSNTTASARYFKWGTNSISLSNTLSVSGSQTTSGSFSGNLTGLTPNTTYFFRAYAVNASGVTVAGAPTISFRTVAAPVTYACNDGADNDNDGLTDFPSDPGCSSANDTNETNVAPVTYACNDGADNDNDGLTDFPSDPGCSSANDTNEINYVPGLPPVATTGAANNVTQNDVTLAGTVNSNGSHTYFWFEYGVNGATNITTNHVSFSVGNGPVSQYVNGLQANTEYSYRVCASSARGNDCGSVYTFLTQSAGCTTNCGGCTSNCGGGCTSNCGGCTYNCGTTGSAPTATTTSSSNVTSTTAVIFGFVNPGNNSTTTQVTFNYGMNGNTNYVAYPSQSSITSAQSVNAFLSNLQPNTVYTFQTCASNQYGQNCGNVLSFITNTNAYVPVQPVEPPYYPTNPTQPPIIIYTNTGGGYDYGVGTSTLASLKINASKRDVSRDDLVSYIITLENKSNRSLKNVKMTISAPMDLALTSTSTGELSFATNSVTFSFSSLAAGDSKSITVTARVANDTRSKSFVVHAEASYLNTLSGERENVTAEVMIGTTSNGMLAGVFGAGFGGGIIWFLVAILIILLAMLAFGRRRNDEVVSAPLPPSRWPTTK
ncbi:MAG: DUF11 domain-containing protein [Candidatus Pacebacteria bacterium]|nr:DUF11 domain-containing protein [Candidatus Paceibacterota bacterium]